VCLTSTFLTYKLCYFVAEKYFFDKFFYYKSTTYGYWIPKKELSFSDFGSRAKDINILNIVNRNILGIKDDNSYKIAIIGDSFVWGQGIKNEQRFAAILENKLNKIKPTKIYSLGFTGDNIFDNYLKYKKSINIFGKMDLYIFALYNNDFVINNDERYNTNQLIEKNLLKYCPNNTYITDQQCNYNDVEKCNQYHFIKDSSLDTKSTNYCLYKNLLPLMPQKNTMYIDLGSLLENNEVQKKFSQIISTDLNVKTFPYNDSIKAHVSYKEGHPSVSSNKTYADFLYQEITTNKKWRFNQKTFE
jgi:hypothetical protein